MDLSYWSFNKSEFECQLTHAEISYGKFYFRALPGNNLQFLAELKGNTHPYQTATLSQHSPAWSSQASIEVSDAPVAQGKPLTFTQDIADLLDAVQGSQWVHLRLTGSQTSAAYLIPTIRIQDSLSAFNRCRAQLPGMTFEEARTLSLPFAFGQSSLSRSQKAKLAAMVSYLKLDDRISTVLIDGHTDSVGSAIANLNTSRQRAETVAETLESLGVTRDMIEIRAHGERYPIANNDSKEGQALNRRVTVRLVRDAEQLVPVEHPEQETTLRLTENSVAKVQ